MQSAKIKYDIVIFYAGEDGIIVKEPTLFLKTIRCLFLLI